MARALVRRRRIFLAATEDTDGTAEALSATDGDFIAFDRELNPEIQMNRRERQDGFGYHTSVPGARMGTLPVMIHLHGSGGSGTPSIGRLLLACGATESTGTYSWGDATAYSTLTAGLAEDGRLRQISGAMGNLEMNATSGNPVEMSFNFTGKLLETKTLSFPSPTFPSVVPPRFAGATLTIGGTSYKMSTVGLNLNATVTMREDPAANDDAERSGDGTGYHGAQIVNIDPVFTFDPEASVSKNWIEDALDGDTAALSMVVGDDSNNTMTISASALQIRTPGTGDRNGLIVENLEMECTGSTLFSIAFS